MADNKKQVPDWSKSVIVSKPAEDEAAKPDWEKSVKVGEEYQGMKAAPVFEELAAAAKAAGETDPELTDPLRLQAAQRRFEEAEIQREKKTGAPESGYHWPGLATSGLSSFARDLQNPLSESFSTLGKWLASKVDPRGLQAYQEEKYGGSYGLPEMAYEAKKEYEPTKKYIDKMQQEHETTALIGGLAAPGPKIPVAPTQVLRSGEQVVKPLWKYAAQRGLAGGVEGAGEETVQAFSQDREAHPLIGAALGAGASTMTAPVERLLTPSYSKLMKEKSALGGLESYSPKDTENLLIFNDKNKVGEYIDLAKSRSSNASERAFDLGEQINKDLGPKVQDSLNALQGAEVDLLPIVEALQEKRKFYMQDKAGAPVAEQYRKAIANLVEQYEESNFKIPITKAEDIKRLDQQMAEFAGAYSLGKDTPKKEVLSTTAKLYKEAVEKAALKKDAVLGQNFIKAKEDYSNALAAKKLLDDESAAQQFLSDIKAAGKTPKSERDQSTWERLKQFLTPAPESRSGIYRKLEKAGKPYQKLGVEPTSKVFTSLSDEEKKQLMDYLQSLKGGKK